MQQRRASFTDEEWAQIELRAGISLANLPQHWQTDSNVIRLALGLGAVYKGGIRAGGFEEGNQHSPLIKKPKKAKGKK